MLVTLSVLLTISSPGSSPIGADPDKELRPVVRVGDYNGDAEGPRLDSSVGSDWVLVPPETAEVISMTLAYAASCEQTSVSLLEKEREFCGQQINLQSNDCADRLLLAGAIAEDRYEPTWVWGALGVGIAVGIAGGVLAAIAMGGQ